MAETRTYQGHTYTRNGPNDPWVLSNGAQPAPRGVVLADPYRQAEEERKTAEERRREQDQQFEAQRVAIAQQQAAIAAQGAGIAAGKDQRDAQAMAARGGVDTTESERTAAFLATRLAGGIQDLQRIGMGRAPTLFEATAGQTTLGNYANEEDWQRALNAQRDIIDASLTLGTGAAYTAEQIDSYRKSYFPQPGDAPATIADKRLRLNRLLEAAKVKSGASASQIDTALQNSGMFAPSEQGQLTEAQQRQYDAILAANPDATEQQLGEALKAAGLPVPENVSDIVGARDLGRGVASATDATYQDSLLGQGMSGVNEGIASTLGFPVDAMTAVMNLVPQGINAVANTDIPTIEDPFMGGGWFREAMSPTIYETTDDPASQFTRRVGQSVGAAAVPLVGTAGTVGNVGRGLAASAAGGVGAATAQQVAPGNLTAEIAAELLASGGAGMGIAAARRSGAQRGLEEAIPTVPQLKEQAGDLYRQAEATGATAGPMETQQLAQQMRDLLRQEGRVSPTGRVSEVYPKTREAMQLVEDYSGQPMAPTQIQTVRGVIADGLQSTESSERRIARLLMNEFDDWAEPLVPGLAPAREVSSRYLTAETLEQARALAEAQASQFTGSGLENAMRTKYRGLDRNAIKGRENFSDPLLNAVENVSRGTPYSNAMRGMGRLAPTGSVSFGLGTVAPATLGTMLGGPVGGLAAGGATGGLGITGRVLATRATDRNAQIAELIARNGGELPQAALMTPETENMIASLLAGQSGTYIGEDSEENPLYLQQGGNR